MLTVCHVWLMVLFYVWGGLQNAVFIWIGAALGLSVLVVVWVSVSCVRLASSCCRVAWLSAMLLVSTMTALCAVSMSAWFGPLCGINDEMLTVGG